SSRADRLTLRDPCSWWRGVSDRFGVVVMKSKSDKFVPSLGFSIFTPYYDRVVRLTTREMIFKSKLIAHAGVRSDDVVLDAGCGTGTLLKMIAEKYPGIKLVGFDADPEMLRAARLKLDSRVELCEAFSSRLPFADRTFSCVVSSLFFHHLDSESKA